MDDLTRERYLSVSRTELNRRPRPLPGPAVRDDPHAIAERRRVLREALDPPKRSGWRWPAGGMRGMSARETSRETSRAIA